MVWRCQATAVAHSPSPPSIVSTSSMALRCSRHLERPSTRGHGEEFTEVEPKIWFSTCVDVWPSSSDKVGSSQEWHQSAGQAGSGDAPQWQTTTGAGRGLSPQTRRQPALVS
ncbi:hypothetical protein FKM82_029394 [Ascaphus truei]